MSTLVHFTVFISLLVSVRAGGNVGPPGDVTIVSFNICEMPLQHPNAKVYAKHKLIDEENSALTGNFTFPDIIDESAVCSVDVSKLDDGGWKNVYKFNGACCQIFRKHIPTLFTSVTTAAGIDPPDCPLPPGTYQLNNYQVGPDILDVPQVFYGRILLSFTSKYATGQGIACLESELDFFPPN